MSCFDTLTEDAKIRRIAFIGITKVNACFSDSKQATPAIKKELTTPIRLSINAKHDVRESLDQDIVLIDAD